MEELIRSTRFSVVDVETTGRSSDRHRVTEIAVVGLSGIAVVSEESTLVNPEQYVSREIQALTGISNAMVSTAPSEREAMGSLDFWLPDDTVLVAHNASFDVGFINSARARTGRRPLPNRVLCTLRLARRVMPLHRGFSLGRLAKHFGVRINGRHRALGDARATAKILTLLIELAAETGVSTLDELIDLQFRKTAAFKARSPQVVALSEQARGFPERPGVYRMYGPRKQLLYVGKAKNLRDRVTTYFRGNTSESRKRAEMIERVRKIDFEETGSELRAILYEARLIKTLQPKFNVAGKRLRRYSFVRIDPNEDWARPQVVFAVESDGAEYFGPFRNRDEATMLVDSLLSRYKLRDCDGEIVPDASAIPCLYHGMGRCDAPCAGLQTSEDYRAMVIGLCERLNGSTEGVLADFRQEMERVAELRDYEAAAEIRDRIAEIERVFVWNRRLIDSVNRNHMILMVPGIEPDTTDLFCVRYGRFAGELTIRRRFPHAGLTKLLERVYNRRDIGAAIDDPIDIDEVRLLASYLKNNGDRGARIPIAARGKINVAMIVDQVLDHHRVRKSRPVAEQEQAKNVGRDGTFRAP